MVLSDAGESRLYKKSSPKFRHNYNSPHFALSTIGRFIDFAAVYRHYLLISPSETFLTMSHGEDAIVCAGCEKEEADENKVIECVECHRYWHTKCKKLYGSTARRARSKPFLCSTECSELRSSVENDKKAEGLIAKVLSEVQCMRQEHAESNRELRNAFKELEKSQSFLAEKFEGINNDIKDLKLGQHFLKGQVDEVHERYESVGATVERLEKEVDQHNRANIKKNAVILGVPATKDENITAVIEAIAEAINCQLPEDAVFEAKRIGDQKDGGKVAPIRVVFANEETKEKLFDCKRTHGVLKAAQLGSNFASASGRIVLRDELTPYGINLLREVRDLQESLEIKFVWPGRDGVILMRRTENSKIERVRDKNDIRKLNQRRAKRSLDETNSSFNMSTNSSPRIQQESKKR